MRILHLIATGQRRGAEVFASDLVAALDSPDLHQRVAVVRGTPPWAVGFGAPVTGLRADRRPLPSWPLHAGAVVALRRLLREWRPDLVQAHGGQPLKYAVVAAASRRPPVVYRRIGSVSWVSSGPKRALYSRLVGRAARVVAVADSIREETVEAFGLPSRQVVTIPNGVDPGRLRPARGRDDARRALGVPPGATVVLSLGALSWEKDPLGHLAVTAPLLHRWSKAVHLFAGDGPLHADLRAAARRAGLEERVLLPGSRDDVGDVLAASDLLLFASRTEGMPASVIEAGMGGLPVAGMALTGVPEVVEDGVTGLLVRPGDHDGLRAAAQRMLEDPWLRTSMGDAARVRCRERYDIARVAAAYRAVYEDLVGAAWTAS